MVFKMSLCRLQTVFIFPLLINPKEDLQTHGTLHSSRQDEILHAVSAQL